MLVRTSNPGAGQFQDLLVSAKGESGPARPLFLHVAAAVRRGHGRTWDNAAWEMWERLWERPIRRNWPCCGRRCRKSCFWCPALAPRAAAVRTWPPPSAPMASAPSSTVREPSFTPSSRRTRLGAVRRGGHPRRHCRAAAGAALNGDREDALAKPSLPRIPFVPLSRLLPHGQGLLHETPRMARAHAAAVCLYPVRHFLGRGRSTVICTSPDWPLVERQEMISP